MKTKKVYVVMQMDTHSIVHLEKGGNRESVRVPIEMYQGQIGSLPVFNTRFAARRLDPTGEATLEVKVAADTKVKNLTPRKRKDH